MIRTILGVVAVGLLSGVCAVSCADVECHGGVACESPDTEIDAGGGADGPVDAVPDVPVPPGCVAPDPKDAPECVVSDFAVFVDAAGSDANPGTKESPVKTLGAALGKLAGKSRVYICEGTYPEHVKLTSAVSLYGGFACASWAYSGNKPKVAPPTKGYGLEITGATATLVVADLDVTAVDATEPGESSIAVFVSQSTDVKLRRVVASAGKAADGTDGASLADFAPPSAPDGTSGNALGVQTPNPACATSIGGAGGKDGAANGGAGQVAVVPVFPAGSNGAGGIGGGTCATGLGTDGSYGLAGAPGAGASSLGTLDATGWKGTDGSAGGNGGNGQGGGGGAQRNSSGIGGSGGPGGCGGAGGTKGTAGGSSVALLVFQSSVAVDASSLRASDAGRGGNAAKGQKAQLASATQALSNNAANACAGGIGGIGGSGGGGGGGAGGLSAGILYKGTAPRIDGASTSAADTLPSVTLGAKGAAGAKGPGGDAAQTTVPPSHPGQDGIDGPPGEAKALMSAP